jgi:hypothetical protein
MTSRDSATRRRRSRQRIAAYVEAGFESYRDAAAKLRVNHNTLWRAARGFGARGPSADLAVKLAAHSHRPVEYWLGGEED